MPGQSAYVPRVVEAQLRAELAAMGAVLIEGPKATGKTMTATQYAASVVRLDEDPAARTAADADPRLLLDGSTPRLLDEWQLVPSLWNAVRRAVDDRQQPGQFILTGSATPADDARRHSGAGRFGHVRMRPMSLFESGQSTGDVSLSGLFRGEFDPARSELDIRDYTEAIVRGGWPQNRTTPIDLAERMVRNYISDAVEVEIPAVTGQRRDPARLMRLLIAYAQVTAQTAGLATIAARAGTHAGGTHAAGTPLAWETSDAYRSAAERLMLIEDLPAWSPRLRSRTRLMGTPKRHLVDPSLAASLLSADPSRLGRDGETLGFLFESLATRDVRVYAQAAEANVSHYRERNGALEADLIVEARDGSWVGIEVKLGARGIDTGATNLLRISQSRVERPAAALVVLTGHAYAYRRDDSVYVVPLGALGP